ncbi:unnamed protein product [Owenia fusiformis]|uniref:Ankyrin repeat, SAM and basic leucine zipper domain-containing protein 1 n=1 Tax=Owenia fusiformis TaxID=6347 RepID=A0A8S4NS90_OWEFU|nr:unnamed protein product [Owenia fusiformis]
MNMSCPAGFEDEEFDEDGFMFSNGPSDEYQRKQSPQKPSNFQSYQPRQSGGFGPPPARFNNRNNYNGNKQSTRTPNRLKQSHRERTVQQNGSQNGNHRNLDSRNMPVDRDDFRSAVQRGNIDVINQYLNDGIAVDTVMRTGWTALMYAANSANTPTVQLLLDKGADPNFNCDQYTVLIAACSSTSEFEDELLSTINLLIKNGANCNAYDRHHMSSLMYAAKAGRALVIQKLLEQNVDINKQDSRGWTALSHAAFKGHQRVVTLLLNHKADPNKQCTDGRTALDLASESGFTKIYDILDDMTADDRKLGTMKPTVLSIQQAEAAGDAKKKNVQFNSCDHLKPSNTQGYRSLGGLELFLHGLDCSDLVPLFTDHQITFEAFLLMDEDALIKLGVEKMGVRKKILDAILDSHKAEWKQSSIINPGMAPKSSYNRTITCQDAVAMVSNINNHVTYITSSIAYIERTLKKNPKLLHGAQEGKGGQQLHHFTVDTMTHTKTLYDELGKLRHNVSRILEKEDLNPTDLLQYKERHKRRNYRLSVVLTGTLLVAGLLWKKDLVVEKITDFYSSFGGSSS